MIPETSAIIGSEHVELIVDGDDENPSIRYCRSAAYRSGNSGFPDDVAVGRIERQDLRIAGRDIETVIPERDTPSERIATFVLWLEIDLPEALSGGGVERGDLDATIHRVNPALDHNRLGQHPRVSGSALPDAGLPRLGELIRQRQVLHCVVRVAAVFRPIRVDDRPREGDWNFRQLWVGLELTIETEDGNPLARQGLLFIFEPTAPDRAQGHEQHRGHNKAIPTSSQHSRAARERNKGYISQFGATHGQNIGEPELLRCECRSHFRSASSQPLGCADIIRKGLVNIERAALVPGSQAGDRRKLESDRTPWIAGRRQRCQAVYRLMRIGIGYAVHDREEDGKFAEGGIERASAGDAIIG